MPHTTYISLPAPSNPAQLRKIAVHEWGEAQNPNIVLCAHGLSRNAQDFRFLAEALAPHYRVLCPDMAGRGESDWLVNKNDYNYMTYASDVVAILLHLGITKVDWVGTSMGGIIAMMLAAQQPLLVKRLVINDIGSTVSAQGLKRILSFVGSKTVFDTRAEAMQTLKTYLQPFGITTESEWEYMCDVSFKKTQNGNYQFAYDPEITKPLRDATELAGKEVTDIDLSMFWNALQCPVLILRGADSDILSRSTAEAMLKRPFVTKLVEFPAVGHAPALLSANQIKVITDWLA
jgi:pimeloyl-ACP methyl ester carboxylesterase